jgi:hypothetical protein
MSIVSMEIVDDVKVMKTEPLMKSGMEVARVGLGLQLGLFLA